MSHDKQDQLPLISPRFGGQLKTGGSVGGSVKEEVRLTAASTSNSSSFLNLDDSATETDTKFPKIDRNYSNDVSTSNTINPIPKLIAVNRSPSIDMAAEISEEVDTFVLDDFNHSKAQVVTGSSSASAFYSTGATSNSSSRHHSRQILAKADRMGHFTECSDIFLNICGLGGDYKTHSIISLVKFTTPEKLQQQAYMLDSLASSSAEKGKGVKWVAELNNIYMETAYELHVTLSNNGDKSDRGGMNSGVLDVELKDMPSSARSSFLNSHSTGMMARQASFVVGGSGGKDAVIAGLRILVVDDSVLVLKVVSRLIQSEGHIVDCKKDGLEALEALKNIEYDAVLMDIHMPEMGGLEASFEFRTHEGLMHQYRGKAQSSKLKIIAMSADFNDELIKEVMNAGFDGFLAKPLTVSGFRELKLRPSLMRNVSCRVTNLVQG